MVERQGEEMGRGWSGFGVKKAYAVLYADLLSV